MTQWETKLRLLAARAVILATFAVLAFQLWQLQVVRREEFQERADRQRFRIEATDAPRGVFYDRNHQLLATNLPKYTVSVISARVPSAQEERLQLMERLSSLLGLPVSKRTSPPLASAAGTPGNTLGAATDLEGLLQEAARRPFEPYPLATNVDRQLAFIVLQDLPRLPGVTVQVQPTRHYLYGPAFAHILGYMWRMRAEQASEFLSRADGDYTANDMVGQGGLEGAMEVELRGRRGRRHVEVDVHGREVAELAVEEAQPGHSLVLTIDRDLQLRTREFLHQGMTAAKSESAVAIVMAPQTGEVLAMVSLPEYDNNLLAQGRIDYLLELIDDPAQREFNRAIHKHYPPGSTFKIIPAAAGLQEQVINRSTTFRCDGALHAHGDRFLCWISRFSTGHGNLNVVGALAQSCNIFFYQMTGGYGTFAGLGIDRLARYARMFGLGQRTGIELRGEAAGEVPRATFTGDIYNASIGQGNVLTTPLQMLNAAVAVANGGTLYQPQLIREVIDADGRVVRPFQPRVIRQLDLSPQALATVREGLQQAVVSGTAPRARLPDIAVAGKTGTAEAPGTRDAEGNLPTHGWFVAYAPAEAPEIAVLVFVEGSAAGSAEGARTAAPIAAKIMRHYFGLPVQ